MAARKFLLIAGLAGLIPFLSGANSTEDCQECHAEEDITTERNGQEVSVHVDTKKFLSSVHGRKGCVACHTDLAEVDLPHDEVKVKPVRCGRCHPKVEKTYTGSIHGQMLAKGEKLAPRCADCHGNHYILPVADERSPVAKINVPVTCGTCHKEGAPVTKKYDIHQDHILQHYSLSIHGEGLFKKGLTVTAVCSDCHTAHDIRPHTDPRSSIAKRNVSRTCQQCHAMIEKVHRKVIRGELWEKEPHRVPVCVDCHAPHKARKVFYELGMADADCLACHGKKDLVGTRGEKGGKKMSMYVDVNAIKAGAHSDIACAQCHSGVSPVDKRPCEKITAAVDCSVCHAEVVNEYRTSIHGKLAERGDPQAPSCLDCHGHHGIKKKSDSASPTFPTNVPVLCGKCHREGEKAAKRYKGPEHDIVKHYTMSIHGKGLLKSGLVVTAMCTDCHTAHRALPAEDPSSSVNPSNVPKTCARCHNGIFEQFVNSVHYPKGDEKKDGKKYPACTDCHSSHTIARTDKKDFKLEIIDQCGRCHEKITEGYFETYHGKVSRLGYTAAAKCYDCHGAHDILPPWDPRSHLSRNNIVKTCGKCHEGSHRRFAGYLTHATHHDPDKYPILYYTFWAMSLLLVGVFAFFWVHTLLWLPRSLRERKRRKERDAECKQCVRRFGKLESRLHLLMVISFLGLVLTGMTLKFSYTAWAQWLSRALGGFESAGYIHRVCALITFFYFGTHLVDLVRRKRRSGLGWWKFIFNRDSMIPNKKDIEDFVATFKWFIGSGPRPRYGRWTYWEKFDYLAVFWGVAVIGLTGLMLWLPEWFTYVLPGWAVNVATIIHSDEALLAAGFIFTVHFFNTHLRPEKFPMDTVIFTGCMPLEELKEDRPLEYERLEEEGKLKELVCEPPPPHLRRAARIFGTMALTIGVTLIVLIIAAEVFGYK
ncbi:MAG: hypothetical protein D6806_05315 [Deltaproteobacteria bacterium]|nr:MAG: hypothetical protein D6806_05315 [Deltaproteobacteria bacterium]